MKSLPEIQRDNARPKGEVAVARERRRHTALTYAKMQLDGAEPWGETLIGDPSLFVCRKCRAEYHISSGFEPCAFCDACKDDVLDILAEALILANKRQRAVEKVMPIDHAANRAVGRALVKSYGPARKIKRKR